MKNKWWKAAVALLAMAALALPVHAASKTPINSVRVSVSGELIYGTEVGEENLEFDTNSSTYSVGDYEVMNDAALWKAGDVPVVEVSLYAADGYYFKLSRASSVHLSGMGATYVSAKKQEQSTILVIRMRLNDIAGQVLPVEKASWDKYNKYLATWEEPQGASSYSVTLYRDGDSFGSSKETQKPYFDFQRYMTREGSYTYYVRAVGGSDKTKRSERTECTETVNITKEEAAQNARLNQEKLIQEGKAFEPGTGGPGSRAKGWIQEGGQWWYSNGDGTYPKSCWWQEEGSGAWYRFDEKGYMLTGWWQDKDGSWYFLSLDSGRNRGRMVTGKQIIHGVEYEFGENGILKE